MVRILVLRADTTSAKRVTVALSKRNHEVLAFTRTADAYQALLRQPFDLVISDMFLRQGGFTGENEGAILLAGRMKNTAYMLDTPDLSRIPVLALAEGTECKFGLAMRQTARSIGVTQILELPLDANHLYRVIDELTAGMGALMQPANLATEPDRERFAAERRSWAAHTNQVALLGA